MELENSQSSDHYSICGNKMDFSLNMSVKDRDLQGRNKHSQILESTSVNGLQEIHNVLLPFCV